MRTQTIALSGLIASLLLTGLAVTGTGCAGNRYQRSTGTYLDDKGITTRVKTALFRDPAVSGFDVHVNTFRGDVQLSGFVNTPEQKDRASQIAREISGVQMVTNNLEIKPASTAVGTSGAVVQDDSRTVIQPAPERPAADLPRDNNLAPVRSTPDTTRELSPRAAENQIPLRTDRTDTLVPQRTDSTAFITPRNLEISASHGRATIRGVVASEAEKRDIERRVRDIPGIQTVENQLELQAPVRP